MFIEQSNFDNGLEYNDVYIVPSYSDISSRKGVDISARLYPTVATKIQIPVMNANMDTIACGTSAIDVRRSGGIPTLHRFQSIESAVKEYQSVTNHYNENNQQYQNIDFISPVFVSIGVNRDSLERVQALYDIGAKYFIIDIAHGHSKQMKDMISFLRNQYKDNVYIMAGNIATSQAAVDLALWGTDAIKCGIGGGAVCTTKNITGVTIPMLSCVKDCYKGLRRFNRDHSDKKISLVADGGIKEIGDICKAIGIGADFVMCGRLFAGCADIPGNGIYRGSASAEVQTLYRTDKEYVPTPEGKSVSVHKTNESVMDIMNNIAGGLRSAYSYVGAHNTIEYKKNVVFGIKYNKNSI